MDIGDRLARMHPLGGARGWAFAIAAFGVGAVASRLGHGVLGEDALAIAFGAVLIPVALLSTRGPLVAAVAASVAFVALETSGRGAAASEAVLLTAGWAAVAIVLTTLLHVLMRTLRAARHARHAAEAAQRRAEADTREAEALKDELRHRMRNLLSVVGGLASASFATGDQRENLRRFRSRLDAHIRAHDLVFSGERAPVPLRDLVRAVLVAFPTDRLDLTGDRALVDADKAPPLGLALHELATNAQKHGAWSNGAGRVRLCVEGDGAGGFRYIEWLETGGPAPEPEPTRAGFGTKILRAILLEALKGEVEREMRPEGLLWRFHAHRRPDAPEPEERAAG